MGTMKIRKLTRRGRAEWVLDYYANGKRVRRWFKTKALAEAEADDLKFQQDTAGKVWLALSPQERTELISVHHDARKAGVSLRVALDAFAANGQPVRGVTLGQAIKECIAAKRSSNYRTRYVRNLEYYLLQFARGRGATAVTLFTPALVEDWFTGRAEAFSTKASSKWKLSALFDFCWRAGYIEQNPVLKMAKVRVDRGVPQILSVERAGKVLNWTKRQSPENLPQIVLGLLAGLRPEESIKITWPKINLEAGVITIDADVTKIRQRRIVHLMPSAVKWLKLSKSARGRLPIPLMTRRRWLHKLRQMFGLERWHQDLLRHTCASMWLAEIQDAGKVAHELGNSAGVLLRHYRELVSREDAEKFWQL